MTFKVVCFPSQFFTVVLVHVPHPLQKLRILGYSYQQTENVQKPTEVLIVM